MAGTRSSGAFGTDSDSSAAVPDDDLANPKRGFAVPGPIGTDPATPLGVVQKVSQVVKDWDASNPKDTSDIPVSGKTLADVGNALNALPEWGRGGGAIRNDPIPAGNEPNVTATLHGNLVLRMPKWNEYDKASAAAKAEWDKMWAKLKIHEQRHVDIAVEECEKLAKAVIGVAASQLATMVTAANKAMKTRQDAMDTASEHGAKENVPYGDVTLDISIT